MKNTVLWDMTLCGSCKKCFEGTYRLHHQSGQLVFLRSTLQLIATAKVVPSWLIISTLMKKAIVSFEMSVLTRAIRHHIPNDSILQLLRH
jgi:hypothetical protein